VVARHARALLIDLDGVIRRWDRLGREPVERRFGLPGGAVARTAFEPGLLELAVTGQITDEEWRQRVVAGLEPVCGRVMAAQVVAEWSEPAGVVDVEVLALLRDVRRRARVCLVTNATTRLDRDLERLGLLGELDVVVNSSSVGARKPDRRIYDAALAAAGVSIEEAFYVDDTPALVEKAGSYGLRGHAYKGVPELAEALAANGLLSGGAGAQARR
jgi:putative hydrolase of the HAD superfamily